MVIWIFILGEQDDKKSFIEKKDIVIDPFNVNGERMEEWVLDTYFVALDEALKHYQPQLNSADVEKAWRPMFAVAWADFQRFIKGWSPNHYKINAYTEELTQGVLQYLKPKESLLKC